MAEDADGTTAAGGDDDHERLLELASRSDLTAALQLADGLLAGGLTVERFVTDIVAPVQRRIGQLWQTNRWTVAQEHAATAVIDAVVGVLDRRSPDLPARTGRIAVVCAEGEWHVLATRLVTAGLRSRGWAVVNLGGSMPAPHLATAARREDWTAAVVCCSISMHLPGAGRSIRAVRGEGVPVLATGAGYGPDERRARALGADGWAADLGAGDILLERWAAGEAPGPDAPAPEPEALALEAERGEIVVAATDRLAERWPAVRDYDAAQLARTHEDLQFLLRFLEAAVMTGDDRVMVEYLVWLEEVLTSRGLPASVVDESLRAVQAALPSHLRRTHDVLLGLLS
ncbi:MAG: B12-binding domain-containing protein [Actinobacteria bacterium]|nr:B12-binding domain-containing protein [Actinomycetota bacterium]